MLFARQTLLSTKLANKEICSPAVYVSCKKSTAEARSIEITIDTLADK